jgi:recombination associated protein RdgC
MPLSRKSPVFKNLIIYRIAAGWAATPATLEERLASARFVPCGPSQEKSLGWVEPRGVAHGPLVESVAGQLLLKMMVETRALPASVVKRKTEERVAQIEASTGRKPGRKEMRDLKDEIRHTLLPMAFTKLASNTVWIDREAGWLVIDAGSQTRADEVVSALVAVLDGFAVTLLNTQQSPASAMAQWLTTQEPPPGFSVDRECELKAADESRAVVRYARHALDTEEVRQHVAAGKLPTRLALTWAGRVSLVLTESLQLKKLAFLEGVFEGTGEQRADGFDADAAIATGELGKLLPELLEALGGELVAG